jgi:hypothetical protein
MDYATRTTTPPPEPMVGSAHTVQTRPLDGEYGDGGGTAGSAAAGGGARVAARNIEACKTTGPRPATPIPDRVAAEGASAAPSPTPHHQPVAQEQRFNTLGTTPGGQGCCRRASYLTGDIRARANAYAGACGGGSQPQQARYWFWPSCATLPRAGGAVIRHVAARRFMQGFDIERGDAAVVRLRARRVLIWRCRCRRAGPPARGPPGPRFLTVASARARAHRGPLASPRAQSWDKRHASHAPPVKAAAFVGHRAGSRRAWSQPPRSVLAQPKGRRDEQMRSVRRTAEPEGRGRPGAWAPPPPSCRCLVIRATSTHLATPRVRRTHAM